jgi:N-acetylglucosamine kinase-like BadF-type ATPase
VAPVGRHGAVSAGYTQGEAGREAVLAGIDAGGSATRARVVARQRVIYEGAGGPGNPLAADGETLRASYAAALAGCPQPAHVAACVSGAGGQAERRLIAGILAGHFPRAAIEVLPDYFAAWASVPAGTDVVVIAGTGSLVCSGPPPEYQVSGGRGWLFGDHGSAARIGQSALEWFCDASTVAPAGFAAGLERLFGSSDWRRIVAHFSSAPDQAAQLALVAPLLTEAVDDGAGWAVRLLDREMTALATTTCGHIERYRPGSSPVRVALVGGVWNSRAAQTAFTTAIKGRCDRPVIVARSLADPVEGAVRLAENMSR